MQIGDKVGVEINSRYWGEATVVQVPQEWPRIASHAVQFEGNDFWYMVDEKDLTFLRRPVTQVA